MLTSVVRPVVQIAHAEERTRQNFNREWRFNLGDVKEGQSPGLDDVTWERVGLPHSFSIPYFQSPDFYVGYGWYRKHFNLPADAAGRRVSLEFEGAFQVAEMFVNGQRVGEHRGGYTGFSIDITGAAHPGQDNVVAVRVNNLWDARLAPRGGEHVFSGGIYRDVYLVMTNPEHVAWYGTFVRSLEVSRQSAVVRIDTEIFNDSAKVKPLTIEADVVDPDGKTVAELPTSFCKIDAGSRTVVTQASEPISNPQLWSPASPRLYKIMTRVLDAGRIVDRYETPFGIRSIEWTADRGFFLNGEHCYLCGVNAHQDQAGWGDAVTNAAILRDAKMIKDGGFNFVRGSHYPHDPAFSEACDKLGLLFWSESTFWGTGGTRREGYWEASAYPPDQDDRAGFEASAKQQLAEMIRIHRNHPSVIAWSMSNEPFFTDQNVMPQARELLKSMVELSRQLDPTRPAAIGGCQRGEMDKLGDVAGYNGDGARLFPNPGIPNMVTEYGSVSVSRPGRFDPGWGDLPTTPGAHQDDPNSWRSAWRSGEAVWCAFDHGSIGGTGMGNMGIIDYYRLPKQAYYWYRQQYAHIDPPPQPGHGAPAKLRLDADKAVIEQADGTDDVLLIVTVLDASGQRTSASPPVTLTIVSGPGEFPTGLSIDFTYDSDVAIHDGLAAITMRSYSAGRTIVRASSPGLEPAEISITTQSVPDYVEGVTPKVTPRPYVRFSKKNQPNIAQFWGRQNPTRVSSERDGHPGRLATDGDTKTFWQPADSDEHPTLLVDFERSIAVESVRISFPTPSVYGFVVECSADGQKWETAVDKSENKDKMRDFEARILAGAVARSMRVRFIDWHESSPRVSELQAFGTKLN
ncbi:glycoside hydrolase family 2 TIM barrel-domain containing protein [soil metagenome]